MSVGLLLITHERIASALIDTATEMLGASPLSIRALPVPCDSDPDMLRERARELIDELDDGQGVLMMTDLYGGTPSNVACSLLDDGRVMLAAGVNLPMLVRVLNYPDLDLEELAKKAVSGGHDGVFCCDGHGP